MKALKLQNSKVVKKKKTLCPFTWIQDDNRDFLKNIQVCIFIQEYFYMSSKSNKEKQLQVLTEWEELWNLCINTWKTTTF